MTINIFTKHIIYATILHCNNKVCKCIVFYRIPVKNTENFSYRKFIIAYKIKMYSGYNSIVKVVNST